LMLLKGRSSGEAERPHRVGRLRSHQFFGMPIFHHTLFTTIETWKTGMI